MNLLEALSVIKLDGMAKGREQEGSVWSKEKLKKEGNSYIYRSEKKGKTKINVVRL